MSSEPGVNLHFSRLYYDHKSINRKHTSQVKGKYKLMLQDNIEYGWLSKVMLPFTNPDVKRFHHSIDGKNYSEIKTGHENLGIEGSKVLFSDICLEFDEEIRRKHEKNHFYKVAELLRGETQKLLAKLEQYRNRFPQGPFFDRIKENENEILNILNIDRLKADCIYQEESDKIDQGNI